MSSLTTPWSEGHDARPLLTSFAKKGGGAEGTAEARKGERETTAGGGGRVEDENGPGVEAKGDATGKVNGPIRGCCGATLEGDGTLGDAVPNEWSRVGLTKIRGTHLALWNGSLPLHDRAPANLTTWTDMDGSLLP